MTKERLSLIMKGRSELRIRVHGNYGEVGACSTEKICLYYLSNHSNNYYSLLNFSFNCSVGLEEILGLNWLISSFLEKQADNNLCLKSPMVNLPGFAMDKRDSIQLTLGERRINLMTVFKMFSAGIILVCGKEMRLVVQFSLVFLNTKDPGSR